MKLQEALAQLRAAADQLTEADAGLAADERAWLDTLDGLTDALDLAEYLGERALHYAALEAAAAERAKAIQARAKRFSTEQDRLRVVILALLDAAEIKKLVRASLTLSARPSPPRLIEIDASATPANMMRQPPAEPDKNAIRDALKLGAEVPGWAMSNGGRTVAIHTK